MIICRLRIVDCYKVWDLAGEFIKESYEKSGLPSDESLLKKGLMDYAEWSYGLEHDGELIGVLGGSVTEAFVVRELVWAEAVFFVAKSHRMKVPGFIKLVRKDLKSRGIKFMTLGLNSNSTRIRSVYKRMGYKFLDAHFISKL